MGITGIPDDWESKFYVMDPLTEVVIFDGTELVEGMVVLIDRTDSREDLPENLDTMKPAQLDTARWNNRWCRVSRIDIRDHNVSFFATYADHTVKKRIVRADYAWLVKIDSLPDPMREKHDEIYRLVYQGLQYQDSLAGDLNPDPGDSITNRAGNITDEILKLF